MGFVVHLFYCRLFLVITGHYIGGYIDTMRVTYEKIPEYEPEIATFDLNS